MSRGSAGSDVHTAVGTLHLRACGPATGSARLSRTSSRAARCGTRLQHRDAVQAAAMSGRGHPVFVAVSGRCTTIGTGGENGHDQSVADTTGEPSLAMVAP